VLTCNLQINNNGYNGYTGDGICNGFASVEAVSSFARTMTITIASSHSKKSSMSYYETGPVIIYEPNAVEFVHTDANVLYRTV